jgi:dTDP-glucose pyrophosphorylase
MKALILAGGRGSRLNKITANKNKSMVELFGKPLIEYNLEHALEARVKEIIIVIGYKGEQIKKHIGNEFRGIKVRYVKQKQQKGLVHAIECAKEALDGEDFFLMLGDEIVYEAKIKQMVSKFEKQRLFALCGIVIEENKSEIGKTYSAMFNEKGRVFRLIEKPRFPINKVKGTGHCILKNEIFDYIERTPINANRGEKELVDMIQVAVDEGKEVSIMEITDHYTNINTEKDLSIAKEFFEKENPRVLIVHPQMKFFGGAELLIVELCNWLSKRGIKNDILTLNKSDEIEASLKETKIYVPRNNVKINSKGFMSMKDILDGIKILRKSIKKFEDYDVINFHNYPSTWALWPKKRPSVWMLNEPPNLWSRPDAGWFLKTLNKIRNWLDKKIVKGIDIICVADDFNKERCLRRYGKDSKVVYYGVNYDFFSKGKGERARKKWNLKNKFVIVQSGVLTENKNQLESLKAINNIKNKIKNVLMIFAGKGEGEYEEVLKDYIKENKLDKNVLFTGNLDREDLRDLYAAADVGLFPVGKQGGWLAPFEMICSGNPIITSEDLGAARVVKKFDLGYVTRDYSRVILDIYENQTDYKRRAKIASKFVKKNLGWNVFADKMIKAYKKSISLSS